MMNVPNIDSLARDLYARAHVVYVIEPKALCQYPFPPLVRYSSAHNFALISCEICVFISIQSYTFLAFKLCPLICLRAGVVCMYMSVCVCAGFQYIHNARVFDVLQPLFPKFCEFIPNLRIGHNCFVVGLRSMHAYIIGEVMNKMVNR